MARRRRGIRWNVYFEHKSPKIESRTRAVYDIGAPGVRSAKEVKLIAKAKKEMEKARSQRETQDLDESRKEAPHTHERGKEDHPQGKPEEKKKEVI